MGYASGVDDVAAAIADPVRRQILEMLRERSLPARRIAEQFAISRPAVSRHLRVLRESGLVHDTPSGRERHYRLDPAPLTELAAWLAGLGGAQRASSAAVGGADVPATSAGSAAGPGARAEAVGWEQRLDALTTEVYRARRDRRRNDTETDTETDRTEKTA